MEKNKIHNYEVAAKETPFMHNIAYIEQIEKINLRIGSKELSAEDYEDFTTEEIASKEEQISVRTEMRIKNAEFQAVRHLQNNNKEVTFLSLRQATTMFMRIIDRRKSYQLN